MPPVQMSVDHGQTWDVARANFESGITQAQGKFSTWIRRVDWSDDRTSATLSGPGYALLLRLDERQVHVSGTVPIFPRLLEGPVKKFLAQAFGTKT